MTMLFGFQYFEEDDRRILATPGIRVRFDWREDRWTHTIEANEDYWARLTRSPELCGFEYEAFAESAHWVPLARAIEGESTTGQPVSPVYQQFHWDEKTVGGCGMLIGQSGPHHYSAVFTVSQTAAFELDVNVADRCRAEAGPLSCTYQLAVPPGALTQAGPSFDQWDVGSAAELRLDAFGSGVHVTVAEAGRSASRVQIVARTSIDSTRRLTYRWTYWEPRPRPQPD